MGNTILVTGATGSQGHHVTNALLERGHSIRVLTRKPDSPRARELAARGATIVRGDFEDRASLDAALLGVEVVYGMGTPYEKGVETETREGLALVDAASAANGIQHFVYSSVADADKNTRIPHFDSKYHIEQRLLAKRLPYTILAPVFFMDNAFAPWMAGGLKQGTIALPMPVDRVLQQVALDDYAKYVARVIERRSEYLGKRINVASDELPWKQAIEILSRVTGRPISYQETSLEQARAYSADTAAMFEWFDKVGYSVDIPALRREAPEVGWHTYEAWAKAQDWSVLNQPAAS